MADESAGTAPRPRRPRPRARFVEDEYDPWFGPTDDEVDEWAERERERRQAWLNGPTEQEKRAWASARRRQASDVEPGLAIAGPTDEEVEDWAARERRRRQAWVEGPTAAERRAYERSGGGYASPPRAPYESGWGGPADERTRRMRRETELATKGLWQWVTDAPYWYWSKLIDAGRDWEEGYETSERPRRIRLYADY